MRFFFGILLALWVASAHGVDPIDHRNVVVMIDATYALGKPETGAGIVVAETPARTVIVTALHVVKRPDTGDSASQVEVEFRTFRGEKFAGRVSQPYWDYRRDLAVVFVDRAPASRMPFVLGSDRSVMAGGDGRSMQDTPVQIVGAMGQNRWTAGVTTDRIAALGPNEWLISSPDAEAGGSGGGVFDSLGRLVGMATHMEGGVLHGLPMQRIADELKAWGVECDLTIASTGSASRELIAAFQNSLKFNVTYEKSGSAFNNIEQYGRHDFLNRVTAIVPADLVSLNPAIEVKYSVVPGIGKSITLSAPDYSAEVIEDVLRAPAQYWLTISDGRKIGPLTTELDFESTVTAAAQRAGPTAQNNLGKAKQQAELDRQDLTSYITHEAALKGRVDKQAAELQAREDALNDTYVLKHIDDTVGWWHVKCSQQNDRWACRDSRPTTHIEHVIRALSLGPAPTDMAVSVSGGDEEEFKEALIDGATRVLQENADATGVFFRLELTNGRIFEARALCRKAETVCR